MEATFLFEGKRTLIQCNKNDNVKDVCQKFANKANTDIKNIYFLYGGNKIDSNNNLNFGEQISKEDKERNKAEIVVHSIRDEDSNEEDKNKISKDVICPQCLESCRMNIEDYKISLFGCYKDHKTENILLKDYYKTQTIDESKITCDSCIKNKSEVYGNKFYRCFTCNQNLCPICKCEHINKKHKILDYELIKYKCGFHNENFISYCNNCRQNLCMLCEANHDKGHEIIDYKNIMPNVENIKNTIINLRSKIDKIKNCINDMVKMFNEVKDNIELFYNINFNLLCNFNSQNRNYQIIQNINSINNYDIIKDINQIDSDKSINNKLIYISNL